MSTIFPVRIPCSHTCGRLCRFIFKIGPASNMRGWQAPIEPVFLQRLPAQVLETYADRPQHIVSGIFGLEVINDLIFALKYALFDSSRTWNNHEKTGCLAVAIR